MDGIEIDRVSTYILDRDSVCVVEDDIIDGSLAIILGLIPFPFLKYYLLMTIMSDVVQLRLCMVFHQARET